MLIATPISEPLPDSLFDEGNRTDTDYIRPSESIHGFLNRVARPELAAARDVLEQWFDEWPAENRADLSARLRAKDTNQFYGAFWELYLHALHRRLGYEVMREPSVPGSSRRPDFLVGDDSDAFYLEATVVSNGAMEMRRRNRESAVIAILGDTYHPDFAIRIRGLVAPDNQPRRRDIVRAVNEWLGTLDWDEEMARRNNPHAEPHQIVVGECHLFLSPWAKNESERGRPDFPPVLSGPTRGGIVNEPPAILDDLREKASAYGELDRPYVIAVLVLRDFSTNHDVEQALFGPEVVSVPIHEAEPDSARLDRHPYGLWQRGEEQRATRVSAVLSAVHLGPWSLASTELCTWHNPWAAHPLNASLPWAAVRGDLTRNVLEREEAKLKPHEIVGLPPTWPGLG